MRLVVFKTTLFMTHQYYLIIAGYPRQICFVGNGSRLISPETGHCHSARECEVSTVDYRTTPEHMTSLKSTTTTLQDRVILFHSAIAPAVFATAIEPQFCADGVHRPRQHSRWQSWRVSMFLAHHAVQDAPETLEGGSFGPHFPSDNKALAFVQLKLGHSCFLHIR